MNENELLALMRAKRSEIGTANLAARLGVSDVTVRSICSGNYPGSAAKVLAEFARLYIDVVHCPHVDRQIERNECDIRATGPRPFGGAGKLAWWEHCQDCEHNVNRGKK